MARAKTCVCGAGRTVARCGIGGAGVCGEARHLEKRMKQHCGLLHRRHHPSRRPTLQRNIGSRLCIVGRLQGNRAERVLHYAAVLSGRAPWACHWRGQACDACGGSETVISYLIAEGNTPHIRGTSPLDGWRHAILSHSWTWSLLRWLLVLQAQLDGLRQHQLLLILLIVPLGRSNQRTLCGRAS